MGTTLHLGKGWVGNAIWNSFGREPPCTCERDGLGMQSETVFPRTGSPELQGMGRAWDGKGWAGEVCADGRGWEERGAIARDGKNWAVEVSSHTPGRQISSCRRGTTAI